MAGGGKISPRQKMINMMYLVLTAMLALNVSAEILKAFYLVEESMVKAGKNIDAKNEDIMRAFAKQMKNQPEKTKPFYDKAKDAEKITADFVKYVEDLKQEIITDGGKITDQNEIRDPDGQLVHRTDIETHAFIMISPEGPEKGKELHEKVNATRNSLLSVLKPFKPLASEAKRIDQQTDLRAENPEGTAATWESELFEHSPQAAVVTLLTKIQNDAKNTEAEVLTALFSGITAEDVSFDMLVAKFIPDKAAVSAGEEFTADVILTAYDSKQNNKVFINGEEYQMENGVVKYKKSTSTPGDYKIKGYIEVNSKDGVKKYDFEKEYSVFKGEASISADKMNVLYIGLDNPITIAIPGKNPNDVKASLSGAGSLINKGGGKYIARVSKRGDCKIVVSVTENGKSKTYQSPFRVRSIPKPEATLGTLESGTHSAGAIKAQPGVYGTLGEGFAYEGVKYSINSYLFVYSPKRGDAIMVQGQGTALPGQARSIVGRIRSGDRIIIDNIQATGPDGKRNLSPLVITCR
ncbi:MAG: gliding motility protein GldM [Bacteroidetes bacterium]|nr:gliding motility protein GldM [Bacteroidota bacterium]